MYVVVIYYIKFKDRWQVCLGCLSCTKIFYAKNAPLYYKLFYSYLNIHEYFFCARIKDLSYYTKYR